MICPCGDNPDEEMDAVFGFDDPVNKPIVAFTVYVCKYCGTIYKKDVWENKGVVSIDIRNNISRHN